MKNETLRISACCGVPCYHLPISIEAIILRKYIIWYCGNCRIAASTYVKPKYIEVAKGVYRKIKYNINENQ